MTDAADKGKNELAYSRFLLRFYNPETEHEFLRQALADYKGFIRVYLIAGIALYMLFGILDLRVGGSAVKDLFFIRYAIACPILLAVFALSFTRQFFNYGQVALASTMVTSGLGIVAMTAILPAPFNSNYYAGLIMVVIYCGSFIRVSFMATVAISIFLVLSYEVAAAFINPIPAKDFLSNNFFLLMSTAVGLLSSYIQETQTRKGYVAQRVIASKNETTNRLLVEANKASRSKSEFLANMSHELRTPLNAIIGFSDIMNKETFGAVGSSRYAQYVKHISDSGNHLLAIINDILDLAKAEANKLTLDEREADLTALATDAVRMCGPKAQERHVSIAVQSCADIVMARFDPKLIKQILTNLISNAAKFSHVGGHVTVSVELSENQSILLVVKDNGIGIAEEDIDRVMRPFEQVEASYARQNSGTGLGLPIAIKLAELHGGSLKIVSRSGAGLTATVNLPPDRFIGLQRNPFSGDLEVAV